MTLRVITIILLENNHKHHWRKTGTCDSDVAGFFFMRTKALL
jgi:hypothetical protein